MLAAIILAAGDSTRMGRPKALLPDSDGRPFVARLVRTFAAAGLQDIVVVTGSLPRRLLSRLCRQPPALLTSSQSYPLGQVSSPDGARAAKSLLAKPHSGEGGGLDGALVTLVAIPWCSRRVRVD